jgi:formate hydrogenlyase subunit 6/NADH:ubiquinone oxidoreductase subunit I
MAEDLPRVSARVLISKTSFQRIFDNLRAAGFALVGPTLRDSAIVLDEITRVEELPRGWCDEQAPGKYRLVSTRGAQYFDYVVSSHSWKQFLYPPRRKLFSIEKRDGQWTIKPAESDGCRRAFVGVRPCDLQAISIQDRVFVTGEFRDPHYSRAREQVFVLAVNCGQAGANCFCTSLKTGPRATSGFDLALTELPDEFVVEIGSEAGAEIMRGTDWQLATAFDLGRAAEVSDRAERQIERALRTDDLPAMLYDNAEHPEWDAVAARCLSCANCTMVCPTCFCSTMEDGSDLRGTVCDRTRVWDSCFTLDFSHVYGGNTRPTVRARYRQWLTHKLATWIDQFGLSGCVGCGRCITWCPVGIDLTEEVQAIRTEATE